MKFMGSKLKIAKQILPLILQYRNSHPWYIEPFCGGCNSLDKVDGPRIAGDSNPYLIAMWKELQKGWIPPKELTREEYIHIRDNKPLYPHHLIGYVGFCCSYSGKFFGGYAGKTNTKIGTVRDYIDESHRNILKQIKLLNNVEFYNCQYDSLPIPLNSTIYCDIPYKETTGYLDGFFHDKFWDWARLKHKEGHKIFISEYVAPDDFECIWQQKVKSSLSANGKIGGSKESIEKLFIYKGN